MTDLRARQVAVATTGADGAAVERLARHAGARPLRQQPDAPLEPGTDLLVVDEWTAQDAPLVRAARTAGIGVTVLAELLLERSSVPILAVTGTAGKSTATRLAAAALHATGQEVTITPQGRAGNAWPNAELAGVIPSSGWFVAELTSTHLCHMDGWSGPAVGVVTNLWPDHLELHCGQTARYVAAKRRLVQRARHVVVLNRDDPGSWALRTDIGHARLTAFSFEAPVEDGLRVRDGELTVVTGGVGHAVAPWRCPAWAHPSAALAGCAAAVACGVDPAIACQAIAASPGLPHRMAAVTSGPGLRVIDDSLAATPAKLLAALARMPRGRTVVVMGGRAAPHGVAVHAGDDEQAVLRNACATAQAVARGLVVFGDAADRVESLLGDGPVRRAGDVADAIALAREAAHPGDVILVSPAFPLSMAERMVVADPGSWQGGASLTG